MGGVHHGLEGSEPAVLDALDDAFEPVGGDEAGDELVAGEDAFAEVLGEAFVGPSGDLVADGGADELVEAFVLDDLPGAFGGSRGWRRRPAACR